MLTSTVMALVLVVGGNNKAVNEDMTSTPSEAKEIVKAISGKWRDESVALIDSPNGKVKKGDKVANIVIREVVAGGYGCTTVFYGQSGRVSNDFVAYDPKSKMLKVIGTGSEGGFLSGVVWKSSNNVIKGAFTITPLDKNGENIQATVEWHLSKDGKTIEIKLVLNGEEGTIKSTRLDG